MSITRTGLDHPDAVPRMLRSWDAGMDTAYIAGFIGITEAEAEAVLAQEREARRRRGIERDARKLRLAKAWADADVDRAEVARRFGYAHAASGSHAVYRQRRAAAAPVTMPERNRMRALREDEATLADIAEATGRSERCVARHVEHIPVRCVHKPDLPRLRRIVAADAAAEHGSRNEIAARFGLAHGQSLTGMAWYARRVLAEASVG